MSFPGKDWRLPFPFPTFFARHKKINTLMQKKKNMVKMQRVRIYLFWPNYNISPTYISPEVSGNFQKLQPTFWAPRIFLSISHFGTPVNQSDSLHHRWHPTYGGPVKRRILAAICVFSAKSLTKNSGLKKKHMLKATFKKEDVEDTTTQKGTYIARPL